MKKLSAFVILIMCLVLLCAGCAEKQERSSGDAPKFTALSDFNGATIASQTGTMFDDIVNSAIDNVTHNYYDDISGQLLALRMGEVDAVALDEPVAALAAAKNTDFEVFSQIVQTDTYGLPMPKGSPLTDRVSEVIERFSKDGTLDALREKWLFGDEKEMKIDLSEYEGYETNGVLRYVHDSTQMPMSYVSDDGSSAGYEVELVLKIARELKMSVEITQGNFSALLTAVSSGKADIVSGSVSITDERRESVDFPRTHYTGGIVLLCRRADLTVASATIESLAELDGRKIGTGVGTVFDTLIKEKIKDADIFCYNTHADIARALIDGKIDAFFTDLPHAIVVSHELPELTYLDEIIAPSDLGFVFPKTEQGELLCEKMDVFLDKLEKDGTLAELSELWIGSDDENKKAPPYDTLPAPNGELIYATSSSMLPFDYIINNKFAGYDIDIAYRFCLEYGYGLNIKDMDFGAVLPFLASGKGDFCGASVSITPERAQTVNFSRPNYRGGVVAVVRNADAGKAGFEGFIDSFAESFNKTFIREERWKLILFGLLITILISLLSAFFGTFVGLALCLARRGKCRPLAVCVGMIIDFIRGIPAVVLLMILFYVVFASSGISEITVAVIGFSINFGVYVAEIIRSGINSIDRGQNEAAVALGLSRVKIFMRVIMPQALKVILPVYKNEFISMMKMTSVVGYIAIQDLTKASDIIRSRTYDALFPLIATALIYAALSWLLSLALSAVEIKLGRSSRRIRGVKLDAPTTEYTSDNSQWLDTNQALISINHLRKEYSGIAPISDLSAEIRRGDVVSIIGPSGTGKSTLLRCIDLLEKPTSGEIRVFGENICDKKYNARLLHARVGMVFQSFNLFAHLTVAENIMLAPVHVKGASRQEAYENALRLLRSVGLAEKALAYPEELSGGQRQRAAIARTLAMNPEIVLFDEPTSALDPTMTGEVDAVIRRLAEQGLTMMIVTHEMKFAHDVSNRIFFLDEGTLYEQGTPDEIFDNPKREKTRAFVRRLKVFESRITSADYDFIAVNQALTAFGEKSYMSRRRVIAMQQVFEELCAVCIIPQLGESFDFVLSAEYSDDMDGVCMRFTYGGGEYNPLVTGDELALSLVRNVINDSKYSFADNINTLELVL